MIEEIIVKLEADIKDYVKKMKKAEDANKETSNSATGLAANLGKFKVAAGVAAGAALGTAAAVAALGAALTAMTVNSATNRRELSILARQAKETESDFKALAFATSQYGINAEQIADITKDVSDRLGEFATAGTGVFQDFADVMGYTADEAQQTAASMQQLSGKEAIQFMVSEMEKAGATTNQMTFALESMGNDLSRLIPLFSDGGREVNRMTARFEQFSSLELSDQQAKQLLEVKENVDLLSSAFSTASDAISATFAPVLNDLIETTISIVPKATETIIDFINSFRSAEDIQSISALERQINKTSESINDLTTSQSRSDENMSKVRQKQIDNKIKRKLELQKQLDIINKQNEAKAIEPKPPVETNTSASKTGGKTKTAEQVAEEERKKTEALREFVQTRREIIENEKAEGLALLEEAAEKEIGTQESRAQRALEIEREYQSQLVSLAKEREEILKKERDARINSIDESIIQAESGIASQRLSIERDFNEKIASLADERIQSLIDERNKKIELLSSNEEIGSQEEKNQQLLGIDKAFNESLKALSSDRINSLVEEKSQKLALLSDGSEIQITQDINARKLEIEKEYQDSIKALYESLPVEVEQEIQQQRLDSLRDFALSRREILEAEYAQEIAMLEEAAELGFGSEKGRNERKLEIESEYQQKLLELKREFDLSEQEYLTEKYQNEMAMLHARHEQGLIATEDYYKKAKQIAIDYGNTVNDLNKDNKNSDKSTYRDRANSISSFSDTVQRINGALLEDNKLIRAGTVVADTAAGIMRTVAQLGMPQATPYITATAALGAAQLASVLSSGKGGGSISGGAGVAAGTTITNAREDFEPEQTTLDITTAIEGGSTESQRVSLDVKGSDDFLDEMADRLAARMRSY